MTVGRQLVQHINDSLLVVVVGGLETGSEIDLCMERLVQLPDKGARREVGATPMPLACRKCKLATR